MDRFPCPWSLVAAAMLGSTLLLSGCSGSTSSESSELSGTPQEAAAPAPEAPSAEDPPDQPQAEPSVDLSASESVVPAGDSVVLSWSSANASSCEASGGWSGAQDVSGSATVGPVEQSTTYTLSCSGAGGNAVAMLSVRVLGTIALEWQPPTENVDGSALTDLAGYRIYYGEFSRSYTDELAVADEASTRYDVELPSGVYYFAMTALDAEGNESAYSNEVEKVVN